MATVLRLIVFLTKKSPLVLQSYNVTHVNLRHTTVESLSLHTSSYLALLGGNGGVPGDESREHAPQSLDPQRQWSHVQQHDVRHVPRQHSPLDRRPYRNGLVGIDGPTRRPAEDFLHRILNLATIATNSKILLTGQGFFNGGRGGVRVI